MVFELGLNDAYLRRTEECFMEWKWLEQTDRQENFFLGWISETAMKFIPTGATSHWRL